MYFLLYLALVIVGIFVLYRIFFKKAWVWLISIILSSFVGFFALQGISVIGMLIIMNYYTNYFKDMYTSGLFLHIYLQYSLSPVFCLFLLDQS